MGAEHLLHAFFLSHLAVGYSSTATQQYQVRIPREGSTAVVDMGGGAETHGEENSWKIIIGEENFRILSSGHHSSRADSTAPLTTAAAFTFRFTLIHVGRHCYSIK